VGRCISSPTDGIPECRSRSRHKASHRLRIRDCADSCRLASGTRLSYLRSRYPLDRMAVLRAARFVAI
jgi:hypothetical protein